jgi:hypothetical protein
MTMKNAKSMTRIMKSMKRMTTDAERSTSPSTTSNVKYSDK